MSESATAASVLDRTKIYIDGEWVDSSDAGRIDVVNPATEEVIAQVAEGSVDDVERAVAAARTAFPAWSSLAPAERAGYLRKVAEGLAARMEELGTLMARDVGTPVELSKAFQIGLPAFNFGFYADIAEAHTGERGEVGNSVIVAEPVGVVACITPWNFPMHQVALKAAAALAAGCTVVVKPSEVAPLGPWALAEVIHEAGLPAGVFNMVSGTGPVVGEALVTHPEVDMISFTGSTRAGKRISELAAGGVKRVALELGGKSANVVLDDADLEAAISDTFASAYLNSGQSCAALTRLLVPRAKLDEAEGIAKRVAESYAPGDPMEATTLLGPLVTKDQLERVRSYIDTGVKEGATLVTGGPEPVNRPGYYVSPTVFSHVAPTMTIAQEEIFGPVLSILAYDTVDEAVEIANGTAYGLAARVWSSDPDAAMAVARRLRAGQVTINDGAFNPAAPFGGYKQSGLGREAGAQGLDEFLEIKAIQR